MDTTLGYVGRAFKPAEEDAVLVKILKGLGAVVVAKTALPQSIMVCFISRFPFLVWLLGEGVPGSRILGLGLLGRRREGRDRGRGRQRAESHSGTRRIIRSGD